MIKINDWLSASTMNGNGSGKVSFTTGLNPNETNREAHLIVKGGNRTSAVTITQIKQLPFDVILGKTSFGSIGFDGDISVTLSYRDGITPLSYVYVFFEDDWMAFDEGLGWGQKKLLEISGTTFNFSTNILANTGDTRTGTLQIYGYFDGVKYTISKTITQSGGFSISQIPSNEIWYKGKDAGDFTSPYYDIISTTYNYEEGYGKIVIGSNDYSTAVLRPIGDSTTEEGSKGTHMPFTGLFYNPSQTVWVGNFRTNSYDNPYNLREIYFGTVTETKDLTIYTMRIYDQRGLVVFDGVFANGKCPAFYNCSALKNIDKAISMVEIPQYGLLGGCSSLTSLTFGDATTEIGNYCLEVYSTSKDSDWGGQSCALNSFKTLTIGKNVQSIGQTYTTYWPQLTTFYCYPKTAPTLVSYRCLPYSNNGDKVVFHYPKGSDYSTFKADYPSFTFIEDL